MTRRIRRLFPSMFHRRLLLLAGLMGLASVVLGAQLARLTVRQGPRRRRQAERALSTRELIDTRRGRILDRKGRVLAEDRPGYDIAVDYHVITGQWAYQRARRAAYQDHRQKWAKMSFSRREQLIADYRPPYDRKLSELWDAAVRLGGIDRERLRQRKETIVERVQAIRADVWGRRAQRRAAAQQGPVELSEVAIPVAEQRRAHTILPAVSDQVAYQFRKLTDELPGLEVIRSKRRAYPRREIELTVSRKHLPGPLRSEKPKTVRVASVGRHLIGSMRDVWAEDVERRPFHQPNGMIDRGGYLPGDRVGRGGIEAAVEARLRGKRGVVVRRRDTGKVRRTPQQPGEDVTIGVDIRLQARVRAVMKPSFGLTRVQPWHENERTPEGTPLYGASVVMDVQRGELLAAVSTPTPPWHRPGEDYPDLTDEPGRPLVNKPLAAIYPPGSTLKPLVYCMAAARGAVAPDQRIVCEGHLLPDRPHIYRCWGWRPREGKYRRHGPLRPAEAIARSCNIYFYTCGRRLGARRLVAELRRWGFGRETGLRLPAEVGGIVPDPGGGNPDGRKLTESNAILMGIGQGPIAVPPVQVAAAHTALARHGDYIGPRLIHGGRSEQRRRDLELPAGVVRRALEGMRQSAEAPYGTAHALRADGRVEPILNIEGVTTRAKTGTAQASPQFEDANGNGKLDEGEKILRSGSHSWFVCHAQKPGDNRASYVIAVMIEYGGSGGRVSGPVANAILHALRAEGYL